MATFLDVSVLKNFAGVFTWLLVWIVAFGILQMTSPFGKENKGLYALVALALSFLVLFTEPARVLVETMVPWFTVLAIGVFFLLFAFMAFGVEASAIQGWVGKGGPWITILAVIIVIFALGTAFAKPAMQGSPAPMSDGGSAVLPPNVQQTALSTQGDLYANEPGAYDSFRGQAQYTAAPAASPNTFGGKLIMVVTHPKVLGLIFVLLLGAFTIVYMAKA